MKLILTIVLLFCLNSDPAADSVGGPAEQYALRDVKSHRNSTIVGTLAKADSTVYLKLFGLDTEVFTLIFVANRTNSTLWYVENIDTHGTIVIGKYQITFDLLHKNRYRRHEVFFR